VPVPSHESDQSIICVEVPVPSHESEQSIICVEVPVPSQESEQSIICLRDIDFASFYNFSIRF
jgi:hypothetical protein